MSIKTYVVLKTSFNTQEIIDAAKEAAIECQFIDSITITEFQVGYIAQQLANANRENAKWVD